jgi:hypothetical protein
MQALEVALALGSHVRRHLRFQLPDCSFSLVNHVHGFHESSFLPVAELHPVSEYRVGRAVRK